MEPTIVINWTAIILAVVANFILGFLWYSVIFGKAWAKEMKMDMTQKPPASVMYRGMAFMVIGNFLMAYVFAHNIAVWNPVTWGQPGYPAGSEMGMACAASFFTWLGFYVPTDLSGVAWEKHSWKLFFINTVYHLLSLFVAAVILLMM